MSAWKSICMASSRDLRRLPTSVMLGAPVLFRQFSMQRSHLDGGAAASNPLLPLFSPARSRACSSVSQVRTPKECGTPVSCCDWPMPRATSL